MRLYEEIYCLKYRPDERKREIIKRRLLHQAAQAHQLDANPHRIRAIHPLAYLAGILKAVTRQSPPKLAARRQI